MFQFKDTAVIVEYQIQEMKFKVGNRSFLTDKYIDTLTWFSIMQKIDGVLEKMFEKPHEWKSQPKKGLLDGISSAINLRVAYQVIPRENTKLDLRKLEYKLDWFLVIKIFNDSFESVTKSASNSASTKVKPSNNVVSSSRHQAPDENVTSSTTELRKDERRKVTSESSKHVKGTDALKVPTVEKKKRTPEKPKSQVTAIEIHPAKLKKLENIVELQKRVDATNDLRKELLKDLEILDCQGLADDQLSETVNAHKQEILRLFATPYRSRTMPIIDKIKYDPLMLTTASIITSNQQLRLLKMIENVRPEQERDTRNDILHEVVLPYITVIIFKETHQLSSQKESYERIEKQEEKKKLFGITTHEDNLFDSR